MELHLANIKRDGSHTFVARKLYDGALNIKRIISFLPDIKLCTFEILGGLNIFSEAKKEVISYEMSV